MPPDVANVLSELTTIKLKQEDIEDCLPQGGETSSLLSYFSNEYMFNKLHDLANKNYIDMSVYVDDITFSAQTHIPKNFINKVRNIIRNNGYSINTKKTRV